MSFLYLLPSVVQADQLKVFYDGADGVIPICKYSIYERRTFYTDNGIARELVKS